LEGCIDGFPVGDEVGAGFKIKMSPVPPVAPMLEAYILMKDKAIEVLKDDIEFVADIHFSPPLLVKNICPDLLAIYETWFVNIETVCGGISLNTVVVPDVKTFIMLHVLPPFVVLAAKLFAPMIIASF
jgi:hypothetical protein